MAFEWQEKCCSWNSAHRNTASKIFRAGCLVPWAVVGLRYKHWHNKWNFFCCVIFVDGFTTKKEWWRSSPRKCQSFPCGTTSSTWVLFCTLRGLLEPKIAIFIQIYLRLPCRAIWKIIYLTLNSVYWRLIPREPFLLTPHVDHPTRIPARILVHW